MGENLLQNLSVVNIEELFRIEDWEHLLNELFSHPTSIECAEETASNLELKREVQN
ncbi:MAG: hypothetical protein IMF11_04660 [Proteobacteria bacterium]|nr:hypothetical protein [Pseudomonadota bacterium]